MNRRLPNEKLRADKVNPPVSALSELDLRQYLTEQYRGVFDERAIEFHLANHVGFGFADSVVNLLDGQVPAGGSILDIGSGFGAFVIAAKRRGYKAAGLEISRYEVEYARERLVKELPECKPDEIFIQADAVRLPFADNTFDAVTMWNILEHVPDVYCALSEARRVIKQHGIIFMMCPNYGAFRREAHYRLFWLPLLPRRLASLYLRASGKRAEYFEKHIFYRTKKGIIRILKRLDMDIRDLNGNPSAPSKPAIDPEIYEKIDHPHLILDPGKRHLIELMHKFHLVNVLASAFWVCSWLGQCSEWSKYVYKLALFYNPLAASIALSARKTVNKCPC
jgi:ubiquinone/menaquinone biosynthesis C-methylase UbiE